MLVEAACSASNGKASGYSLKAVRAAERGLAAQPEVAYLGHGRGLAGDPPGPTPGR